MKTVDIDNTIIDGYLRLLNNLSANTKLELISKLTLLVKTDINREKSFFKAFGAWDKKDQADNLINEIRSSRTFNRKVEEL
jgi:hypothetical protein